MTHFTRVAAVAALTLVSAGAALAADLPARMAPPAPYVAPVPVFTWTGPYFGINGGYSFDDRTKFNASPLFGGAAASNPLNNGLLSGARATSFKNSDDGFTAGGQVGYNYQLNGFGGFGGPGSGIVVGFEADAAYIDSGRTSTFTGRDVTNGLSANSTFRSGIDFLGTVRGRVGYAFNQFLIYGTGGFAYGDTFQKSQFFTENNPNLLRFYGSHSGIQTGYAYGGGIEYAIPTNSFLNFFHSSAVTVKAEYLHYDLGNSSFSQTAVIPTLTGYSFRTHTSGDLARVGLNYKF